MSDIHNHRFYRAIRLVERAPICVGNEVSLADIVLVPQMYQARKFKLAVDNFPRLCEIEAACLEIDGFRDVAPKSEG